MVPSVSVATYETALQAIQAQIHQVSCIDY
jgi:hypothetical protein